MFKRLLFSKTKMTNEYDYSIHAFLASAAFVVIFNLSICGSFADSVEYWTLQFDSSVPAYEGGNRTSLVEEPMAATMCLHKSGNLLEGQLMYPCGSAPNCGGAFQCRNVEGHVDKNQIFLSIKHLGDRSQISKSWQEGFAKAANEFARATLSAEQYRQGVTRYTELANTITVSPSAKGNDLVLNAQKAGDSFSGMVTQSLVEGTGEFAGMPSEFSGTRPIPAPVGAKFKMARMTAVPKLFRDRLQTTPAEALKKNLQALCMNNASVCAEFASDSAKSEQLNAEALKMFASGIIGNGYDCANLNRSALQSRRLHRHAQFYWFCNVDGKTKLLSM